MTPVKGLVDIPAVVAQTKRLSEAQDKLAKAKKDLARIKALCGQTGYNISIDGVLVAVAEMDRSYNGKLIRGREMIHLGALKALDASVDAWTEAVARQQAVLTAITTTIQEARQDD